MNLFSNYLWLTTVTVCSSSRDLVNGGIIKSRTENLVDFNRNCYLPPKLLNEIVDKIVEQILYGIYSGDTWKSLTEFIDKLGPRFSGSISLDNSIDYMVAELKGVGLENVHTEIATLPHWQRGYKAATLIRPHEQNLPILGLGFSIGTLQGAIVGDVVALESFDEFDKLNDDVVFGKIVVFVPKWVSYKATVQYRLRGASVASKKGAVSVRSITPFSIGSPHTGMQTYEEGVVQIPAAALTVEDAEMLLRLYRRGENKTIRLEMEVRNMDSYVSRNTISELQERTHEVAKK